MSKPTGSTDLTGKSVVITGAGQGIGAAYARFLAGQGARVLVNDVDEAAAAATTESITRAGGSAATLAGSVADPAIAAALVADCVRRWGRLDGFVNNAGIFHANSFHDEDEAQLRELIEVNVLGTGYCALHALRQLRAQDAGALVNITSGTQAGAPGLAAYSASKGAVASLTYALAMEVAGTGVRVNAVSPNAHTRMANIFEKWLGHQAAGQNVGKQPESNAPIVGYLLSDAAAEINGQVIRVDGAEVSLMSHPQQLDPATTLATDDLAELATGFGVWLAEHSQPLGLSHRPADLG